MLVADLQIHENTQGRRNVENIMPIKIFDLTQKNPYNMALAELINDLS